MIYYRPHSVTNDFLNIPLRCISTSLESLLDNDLSSKIHPTTNKYNYIQQHFSVTDMDRISTRSIGLHPCTVLEATGESGGLLLNIGLILKWFSLLLSYFWIRLILMLVYSLLVLGCIAPSPLYV